MSKLGLLAILIFFLLNACSSNKKPNESVKFQQYYVEGEQLYLKNCSNCHQKSGKGLGLVYPPLDESDYMDENLEEVICLIKNGKSGELRVNGKSYNLAMPGVPTLTDLEIAEIATYVYNTWTHNKGIIELQQVSRALANCEAGT